MAHGAHGGGGAATGMGPITPEMADWLEQKRQQLSDAYTQDKSGQEDADRRALLMQFAQSYVNQKPMPVAPRQVNEARSKFGTEIGLEQMAAAPGLAALRQQHQTKPGDEPAPPEWGAPAGMTKAQAISAGFSHKPKDEKPLVSPTADQVARGKALGIHPAEHEDSIHFEAAIRAAENASKSANARGANREDKKAASGYLGPDFEFGPEVPPMSVPDATRAKLMDEAGLVNHVTDSAQRLRDLLKKYGPHVMGKAATEMSTLVEDLKLTVKDPVYNLGVLNGRDYELISKVISDPTSAKQILASETGVRDLDTALRTAQSQWKSKIRQRMRGYGAAPVKGGRYFEEAPAAPAPGRRPRRTDPATGETREWDGSQWVPVGG